MGIMITYTPRYSRTDEPDELGRWARLANYKNIRIAWINKITINSKIVFNVSCHFPTRNSDTANEHRLFGTLEESKAFVEERWNWFTTEIS